MAKVYGCNDLVNAGYGYFCCNSCHDEFDGEYTQPMEHYNPDSNDEIYCLTCCGADFDFDDPELWNKLEATHEQ